VLTVRPGPFLALKKLLIASTLSAHGKRCGTSEISVSVHVIKDIDFLARQIAREGSKYIFWLGAGVSVTAGIPTAAGVVDRLLDRLWRQPGGNHAGEKDAVPYASLSEPGRAERLATVRKWALESIPEARNWQTADCKGDGSMAATEWGTFYSTGLGLLPGEEDRQEFIVECFKEGRGRLNVAHLLMCQLMVNNFVRTVVTTNFDDLLLRALQLYFEVPAAVDPDSLDTLMTHSTFLQVAYLHGKLSSYRQRHTDRELRQPISHLEKFLTPTLKDHGLVIVGYRGGDEQPMSVLEKVLEDRRAGPGRGLFWVSYESDFENLSDRTKRVLQFKDTYWLPNWDADTFFEKLCASQGIGLSLPDPKELSKRLEEILPEKARSPRTDTPEAASLRGLEASTAPSPSGDSRAGSTQPDTASQPEELGSFRPELKALWETANPESAIALSQEALAQDPSNFDALLRWGVALGQLSRSSEALPIFEKAAEIRPGEPRVFVALAGALQDLGRSEEAVEKASHAIELNSGLGVAFAVCGRALQSLGRYEEATENFRRAAEQMPGDAEILALWGHSLQQLGRNNEAIERYQQAIQVDPTLAWVLANWAQTLQNLGRLEDAAEKYRQATEVDPSNAWALAHWGETLQDLGRHEEAIDKLRRATEIGTDDAWTYAIWGYSLKRLGRFDEAIEKFRRAIERSPDYAWAYSQWGDSLQELGRHEEAVEKLRRATEIAPDDTWTYCLWGRSLQQLGRHEEAIERFRRATEADPNYEYAYSLWGRSLEALGRRQEAIEKFRLATEADPNSAWSFSLWGRSLQNLGQHEEAIEKFRRATEVDPAYSWAFLLWADSLDSLGRHEEAEQKRRRHEELESRDS